jgi:hypothetical protein
MTTTGKLQRLLLILDRVRQAPSFAQLQDHLHRHGIALSSRTLQRDVELMRATLGLDVRYDRETNTYHLSGARPGHDGLIALVERASLGELLTANTAHLKDLVPVLDLQEGNRLLGLVHWLPLAKAAHERRWVNVTRMVGEKASPALRLKPLRLREQGGHWTLVAHDANDRPLGDRVGADPRTTGDHRPFPCLGVEDIVRPHYPPGRAQGPAPRPLNGWCCGPRQTLGAQLARAPLHPSQKVLKQGPESHLYELTLPVDETLFRTLMGQGAEVRVMEPSSLVKRIAKAHKTAAKQYK